MKPTSLCLLFSLSLLSLGLPTRCALGQAPAPLPPPTLWSFLGIPQTTARLRDGLVNRRGNFPGLEKKPPLKKLADPANLASDNPAIKRAAEIKKQEDLKKQKIKALKYLAKIGCGCYDQDGSVTAALEEATKDCTEAVRLAAVQQIKAAADGGCCSKCSQKSCCNEKIVMRLAQMAYERDENGCYLEGSEEVREAAKEALKACCPRELSDLEIQMEQPEPVAPPQKERETAPDDGDERESVPGTETEAIPPVDETALLESATEKELPIDETQPQQSITELTQIFAPEGTASVSEGSPVETPEVADVDTEALVPAISNQTADTERSIESQPRGLLSKFMAGGERTSHVQPEQSQTRLAAIAQPVGSLAALDGVRGIAHVHVTSTQPLPVGSRLHVFHKNGPEQRLVGTMAVYESFADSVNVRATGDTDLSRLQPGDPVWTIASEEPAITPMVRRVAHSQTR